jgi:hypothetical protein
VLFLIRIYFADPSRILQFSVTDVEKKREHFEVTENETIHLICSVDSNPVSSTSLLFKEQELWRYGSKGLIYTHKVESCFDAGVYTCFTHNKYNKKPSMEELTLRVRCKSCFFLDNACLVCEKLAVYSVTMLCWNAKLVDQSSRVSLNEV